MCTYSASECNKGIAPRTVSNSRYSSEKQTTRSISPVFNEHKPKLVKANRRQ